MKNKIIKLLVLCLCLCLSLFTFTACDKHECKYDQQIVEEAYFASDATCTEKTKYYLSCTCGKFKEATFEYGEALGHEFTNYVPDNNATYDNDGTKTATCNRGCGVTDSVTDNGTKLQSHLEFKTLSLESNNVFANAVDEFSFIDEIRKFGYSEFEVARDKYGETVFSTGIVPLNEGDNTFYVLEKINGQYKEPIKVILRRHPIYQVTINFGNGQPSQTQLIEESFTAQQPETNPDKDGYTFTGWDFDFNTAITQDIQINAKWCANTNTPYSVEYYLQNLNDNGYTLQENETKNLTGTTDTTVYANIKTFDHFTPEQTQVSANLNGNGKTVLKVYYTRNYYTITVQTLNNYTSVTGGGNYANAESVTVKATITASYVFDGWYNGTEKLSGELEYTFNPTKDTTLKAKAHPATGNINLKLVLECTLRNETVKCKFTNETELFELGFQKLDETTYILSNITENVLIPELTSVKPLDSSTYGFSSWKYGKTATDKGVTVYAGTEINAMNFPILESSNELVLVVHCYSYWTPFY